MAAEAEARGGGGGGGDGSQITTGAQRKEEKEPFPQNGEKAAKKRKKRKKYISLHFLVKNKYLFGGEIDLNWFGAKRCITSGGGGKSVGNWGWRRGGGRGVIWRHDWSEKKGGIFQSIKMRLNGGIDLSLFGGENEGMEEKGENKITFFWRQIG